MSINQNKIYYQRKKDIKKNQKNQPCVLFLEHQFTKRYNKLKDVEKTHLYWNLTTSKKRLRERKEREIKKKNTQWFIENRQRSSSRMMIVNVMRLTNFKNIKIHFKNWVNSIQYETIPLIHTVFLFLSFICNRVPIRSIGYICVWKNEIPFLKSMNRNENSISPHADLFVISRLSSEIRLFHFHNQLILFSSSSSFTSQKKN